MRSTPPPTVSGTVFMRRARPAIFATKDIVYMLEGLRIKTGIDIQKLLAATNKIRPARLLRRKGGVMLAGFLQLGYHHSNLTGRHPNVRTRSRGRHQGVQRRDYRVGERVEDGLGMLLLLAKLQKRSDIANVPPLGGTHVARRVSPRGLHGRTVIFAEWPIVATHEACLHFRCPQHCYRIQH